MSRPGEYYGRFSLIHWVIWQIARMAGNLLRGIRESALWGWRAARNELASRRNTSGGSTRQRPIVTLILIGLPIAIVVWLGPKDWFLNWPVMLVAAAVLTQVLRGPLAEAPSFLKKVVKLAISFCLLIAFTKLLFWQPLWELLGASALKMEAHARGSW